MVQLHDLARDMRLKRVVGIWEFGQRVLEPGLRGKRQRGAGERARCAGDGAGEAEYGHGIAIRVGEGEYMRVIVVWVEGWRTVGTTRPPLRAIRRAIGSPRAASCRDHVSLRMLSSRNIRISQKMRSSHWAFRISSFDVLSGLRG